MEDTDYKQEDIQIDKTLSNTENTDIISTTRTGDETPVALWIGILIVACVLVVGILIYRKNTKMNNNGIWRVKNESTRLCFL